MQHTGCGKMTVFKANAILAMASAKMIQTHSGPDLAGQSHNLCYAAIHCGVGG